MFFTKLLEKLHHKLLSEETKEKSERVILWIALISFIIHLLIIGLIHFNIISVLWHDNVLKMKGGRMYEKILEYLTSQDDVEIVCGIDLVKIINKLR